MMTTEDLPVSLLRIFDACRCWPAWPLTVYGLDAICRLPNTSHAAIASPTTHMSAMEFTFCHFTYMYRYGW
jgi:hypothetical protein